MPGQAGARQLEISLKGIAQTTAELQKVWRMIAPESSWYASSLSESTCKWTFLLCVPPYREALMSATLIFARWLVECELWLPLRE